MATNAEIFHFLLNQQRDAIGIIESGSALFYEAGTSNLKNVWTDRDKNTISANPATLAQDGTVAVYGDGTYRVVIKDSDGVVVHDYPAIEMGFVSNNLATIVADCEAAQKGAEDALAEFSEVGDSINARFLGVVGDGVADDTEALQAAFDYIQLNPDTILHITGIVRITDTVSYIPATAWELMPTIKCIGHVLYDGGNDRPALSIGASGKVLYGGALNIDVRNATISLWADADCVGVDLINLNSSPDVKITRATGFTSGVRCSGAGAGFAYNNITLGYLTNNGIGVDLLADSSGWVNENLFLGGRFAAESTVNTTTARTGVRLKSLATNSINNNVFVKPSFELKESAAHTLGTAAEFINAKNNHIIDCRSEGTWYVAKFDVDSLENMVEVGYATIDDLHIEDLGLAGNIVVEARNRHIRNTTEIFSAPNLADLCGIDGSDIARFSGMQVAVLTSGVLQPYATGVTIDADGVVMTNSSHAVGVVVDTTADKSFVMSVSSALTAGRMFILCFDNSGSLLTGTSPY